MEVLCTYDFFPKRSFEIGHLMQLYNYIKESQHEIYAYQDQCAVDAADFSKLLSFFLMSAKDKPIVFIIAGNNSKSIYQGLQDLTATHASCKNLRYHQYLSNQTISI